MKCDRAFDLMTDPTHCDSQSLQSHLARCPRCRQMQETLAPALDWLGESSTLVDTEPLPPSLAASRATGVRAPAFAAMEALEIAHESATQLSAQTTPARDRYLPSPGILLRSAALIALGAYAAIAFVPGSRPAVPSTDDRDCLRQEAAAAIGRSPAEAERIMTTCAACHERDGRLLPRERQNGAIDSRTSWRHAEFQDEFEKLWSMALSEQGAEEAGRIALAGQVNDPADETRGLWQRREERDA